MVDCGHVRSKLVPVAFQARNVHGTASLGVDAVISGIERSLPTDCALSFIMNARRSPEDIGEHWRKLKLFGLPSRILLRQHMVVLK